MARRDPYKNFNFRVKFEGRYVAGVSAVSGLHALRKAGKSDARGVARAGRKLPGLRKYASVTLKRGITFDPDFENWAKRVHTGPNAPRRHSKDVWVEVYDEAGRLTLTHHLAGCWVSKYEAAAKSGSSATAIERVELRIGKSRPSGKPESGDGRRRGGTGALAQITPRDWGQLDLPDDLKTVLRGLTHRLKERLGARRKPRSGPEGARRSILLFTGANKAQKALAAEAIAHDLQLDLFRVDLSRIVTKYIGETDKNLREIFDRAQDGGAVLFFDEADALFGERTEVKDAHDRYVNLSAALLILALGVHRTVAILSSRTADVSMSKCTGESIHFPRKPARPSTGPKRRSPVSRR
jgi:phage tail-like protein